MVAAKTVHKYEKLIQHLSRAHILRRIFFHTRTPIQRTLNWGTEKTRKKNSKKIKQSKRTQFFEHVTSNIRNTIGKSAQ